MLILAEKLKQPDVMPASSRSGYQRLFEVRLLHHHWLDEGTTIFDQISDQVKRNSRLLNYDKRSLLAVRPTLATRNVLAAHKCLFLETAMGFIVVAPATARISAETVLEFIVTLTDHRVCNYTDPSLRPQRVCELYNELDNSTYRYKENVPVLSNLTGAMRVAGASKALFLSREQTSDAAGDPVLSVARSEAGRAEVRCEDAGVAPRYGASEDDAPVFLHHGDVPAIMPPPGLTGVPERGVRLSNDIADDVFIYVSLTATRASDDAFSFVNSNGSPKAAFPVYQVRFRNRSPY